MPRVVAEIEIAVGSEAYVAGQAPRGHYSAIFEDDGDTGYFYAYDLSQSMHPIRDAMHIYNSANVTDRSLPSTIAIGWSKDSLKAVLLINNYPHALFDFCTQRGYCRTGFPPPSQESGWSRHGWEDSVLELVADAS